MKPTKEILTLLKRRTKAGESLNKYEVAVREWCIKNNVDVADIENDYGCMVSTEPCGYEKMFLERIEESN